MSNSLTQEIAKRKLEKYLEAEEKVLLAQEYKLEGRVVTRANLKEIREGIKFWEKKCINKNLTKIRSYRVQIKND
ncbi:hypothetical protein SAMN02745174_02275 [Cetobacterium ceti]|uniref:Uncharacterized protein n=1 Tax=Cetobacterium ceti TaxID=180163 RepID=A0A1T4QCY9_9FUSO|nr:DUF6148 family protein [Cetobacterium ceti]SKA01486.1 hypothetical protein SAMN02745174_02275 [Cetobacterium ceti]